MLIQNYTQYNDLIETLYRHPTDTPIAIDTETTGLRPWGDTTLRGISIATADKTWYVPYTHPGAWNVPNLIALEGALRRTQSLLLFHNGNYDRAVLERVGINLLDKPYRDTMILGWLTDENRPKGLKIMGSLFFGTDAAAEQKALKALMKGETRASIYSRLRAEGFSVQHSNEEATKLAAQSKRTWADLTAAEIHTYAEQDTRLTYDLYHRLLQEQEYPHVEPAVQRMHDLQNVVYRMVKRGVQIVPGVVRGKLQETQAEMETIKSNFTVNLDSPKQLAALIYNDWGLPIKEKTEKGEPSTSRAALKALAGMHSGLDEILRYRRLGKSASAYYLPFLSAADENNRIHPSVNVVGTVTGRFAYSDPNLQTIPRDGTIAGVKECFTAGPGRILVSYDLKSAELRFMASLSGETQLIEALERGEDIYQLTADRIGCTRQVGKSLVLSWPYGVGPVEFARASGLSVKESRHVIAGFEATYVDLSRTMSKLSRYADIQGRLPLLEPGRFRRFVGPHLKWPVPSYTALNAACQGGVADFMGNVMIQSEPYWTGMGAELVLQVHDSLVFEVIPGTQDHLLKMLSDIADKVNPLSMRLVWEMKEGL